MNITAAEQRITGPVELAQRFQRENGGFLPFGQVCERGAGRKYQAGDGGDEQPNAAEMVGILEAAYRRKAEEGLLEWATLLLDVHVVDEASYPDGIDAIQAIYEDEDGCSLSIFIPYRSGLTGVLEYQTPFIRERSRSWFPA